MLIISIDKRCYYRYGLFLFAAKNYIFLKKASIESIKTVQKNGPTSKPCRAGYCSAKQIKLTRFYLLWQVKQRSLLVLGIIKNGA